MGRSTDIAVFSSFANRLEMSAYRRTYPYASAPERGSALNVNGRLQIGIARLVAANI